MGHPPQRPKDKEYDVWERLISILFNHCKWCECPLGRSVEISRCYADSGAKFGCCVKENLASFYRSINAILRIDGHPDELVRLRLLEAHCLPILTYGIEIIHVLNRDDCRQLWVAYNSIFQNLFQYAYNESVTALQHALNRPTWEDLCDKRKRLFLR